MADGRDVPDATFDSPDLTTFTRLDELGRTLTKRAADVLAYAAQVAAGQRVQPRHCRQDTARRATIRTRPSCQTSSYDATRASPRTWLYRIAANACLSALEGRARRP
jgi:hypothetical protein